MREEMLFLSEMDIRLLLTPERVVSIVENVFRSIGSGSAILGPFGRMPVTEDEQNFYLMLPSVLPLDGIAGMKWFCGYANPKPGYPFSHGNLIILTDIETGSPILVCGASTITAMRAAGGHGVVAAKYLASSDPDILTVIGCGRQAQAGIESFLIQFPSIEKVNVFDRIPDAANRLKTIYADKTNVVVCKDVESAVRESNLVMTVSTSKDIIVRAEWIENGTTIIAINAFSDLDPRIAERADKWILGNIHEDTRSIIQSPLLRHNYPLEERAIYADLSQIVCGVLVGRERADEIILYSHMGMGLLDIACAKEAHSQAKINNVGQVLFLDEFQSVGM